MRLHFPLHDIVPTAWAADGHALSARRIVLRRSIEVCLCVFLSGCGSDDANPPHAVANSSSQTRQRQSEPNRQGNFAVGSPSTPQYQTDANSDRLTPKPKPSPVYRPSDVRPRPQHDDAQLAKLGIHKYQSTHLKLFTDIAPELAQPLPALMDQVYRAWEAYFGPMLPDREGTPYQMTGYIMADRRRFVMTGLLPADLPGFLHGRHRGAEFWMNDQQDDYYRRHLMLHEGTHCFMTTLPNVLPPVWYLEGMAELFGTHSTDENSVARFRVMPDDREKFQGLGRIRMIEDERKRGRAKTLDEVLLMRPNDFLLDYPYAWSWAMCKFLDTHPRYRERFRDLGQHTQGNAFRVKFAEYFQKDNADIKDEWILFVANLCHGFDIERAAIEFRPSKTLKNSATSATCEIVANRGWQSSRIAVEAGRVYLITAQGRFTVAQQPKPWVSEADGVSIRYHHGHRVGMLLATVRSTDPQKSTMLDVTAVGGNARYVVPVSGTLYFRINDYWNELADNSGKLTISVMPADISNR